MDKRAFSKLPRPKVTKRFRELRKLNPKMKGIVTIERMEINGRDTLIINSFKALKRKITPWFRTFCQEEDFITQDLREKKVKWRRGGFDYITSGWNYSDWGRNDSGMVLATMEDRERLMDFFLEWRERTQTNRSDAGFEFDDYIGAYHQDIRDKRLEERHRKIRDKIDGRMALFGELPEDYQEFIEKTVFDDYNYFFYSKKDKYAYCTRCGHEYEIRKDGVYHRKIPLWDNVFTLKHNRDYICPYCGLDKPMKAKSIGYGRGSLLEVNWSVLIQASGESVLVRYLCHTKDFRGDFMHPKISTYEMYRTIHGAEDSEDYEMGRQYFDEGIRWGYAKNHGWGWNPSEFVCPRHAVLYNTRFEFLKDTCMRYSSIGIFIEKVVPRLRDTPWIADQYMKFYRSHPFMEQLLKIGWFTLVKELFESCSQRDNFINGRTVLESCGITRVEFLLLKEATYNDPRIKDIKIVRAARVRGLKLTAKDLSSLGYIYDAQYENFLDAMEYTTLYKLQKYLTKQQIRHYQDYFDFLGWLREMGYDMRNEFNIYPRDFKAKHDEMAKAYIKFKNKRQREDIRKFNRLLKKLRKETSEENPLNCSAFGLFIRLPNEVSELQEEGEILHHCVGTYVDRVIKGETAIYFVRKVEEPEKPYFTLEWKNHKIIQCRGFRNCEMNPEVRAFTTYFEEKMREHELGGEAV